MIQPGEIVRALIVWGDHQQYSYTVVGQVRYVRKIENRSIVSELWGGSAAFASRPDLSKEKVLFEYGVDVYKTQCTYPFKHGTTIVTQEEIDRYWAQKEK